MTTQSKIQLLDELTANQIAAGEVVERPANALKEMIENSLDAGAKRIRVEVRGGGRKLLKVSDDGQGMIPEELPMAILRHATSKLRKIEDLDQLFSLGFRGEALASIAAVSRVTITSRTADATLGHVLEVRGGETLRDEPAGAELGTTIQVEELFYNMPAREKFMKSDSAEHRAISEMMTRFALARPDVSFLLEVEGKRTLFTQGELSLHSAAGSLFGGDVEAELLPVDRESPEGGVKGLVGKPTLVKSNRAHQYFFINGRWIQSGMLSQAVSQAYESMMPRSGFAFVILNLTLDPSTLDINIHPQKTEIRFKNDKDIFRIVRRAIQDALSSGSALPSFEGINSNFPREYTTTSGFSFQVKESGASYGATPTKKGQPTAKPVWEEFHKTLEAGRTKEDRLWGEEPAKPVRDGNPIEMESLDSRRAPVQQVGEVIEELGASVSFFEEEIAETSDWGIQPLGQVGETYIIARTQGELILIDQHAAHERILFDQLMNRNQKQAGQVLLTDWIIQLDESEIELLLSREEELSSLGWKLSSAGPTMLRIEESPLFLGEKEAEEFIRQLVGHMSEEPAGGMSDYILHSVGHMRSCKAALKGNQSLHMEEIHSLLDQLQRTENPYTCPHGRPVVIRMTLNDLAKMFKRI